MSRRLIAAPLGAGVVLLLLLGAVAAGLRVPGLTVLNGLPGLGLLDYRTLSSSAFLPLRADYLDQLLGTAFGEQGPARTQRAASESTGAPSTSAVGAPSRLDVAPAASEPAATVLEHELTNDDFERAIVVRRVPFTARTSTAEATRQDGEPADCSTTGGTAWYRYTPAATHAVFADTFGTQHATALGVFSGSTLRTAQRQACASGPTGNASTGFTARAGTTYFIQVTSLVRGGPLVFNLSPLGTTSQMTAVGRTGIEQSHFPGVSGDGRYASFATLIAPTCPFTPCDSQIVVVDRRTGRAELVSRTPTGAPANGDSSFATFSHDGRYVGFSSSASDLVEGDTNGGTDYFVHDRATRRTLRASVSDDGKQGRYPPEGDPYTTFGSLSPDGRYATFSSIQRGLTEDDDDHVQDVFVRDLRDGRTSRASVPLEDANAARGYSVHPVISRGGRYVLFLSPSTEFVEAEYGSDCRTASCLNVFVRDRQRGHTVLVSRTRNGAADDHVARGTLSADGRVAAWTSSASEVVASDTNGVFDTFVQDLRTGRTKRVSVSSMGEQQNDPGDPTGRTDGYQIARTSRHVALSADGRHVAFDSRSTNLVPNDSNGASDVFMHDVLTGATTRVSVSSQGAEGNADSLRPALSADGRVVVFQSEADNLAPGDDKTSDVFVHDLRRG